MSSAGVQVGDADERLAGEEAPCRKRVVAAPLREPFAVTSDDPSVSAFDGMLVGFFGGVLGGFVVGGAASSGGLDIALDAELGAVVGIVLGVFVVMLAAMGRRVLQRRRPRHPRSRPLPPEATPWPPTGSGAPRQIPRSS